MAGRVDSPKVRLVEIWSGDEEDKDDDDDDDDDDVVTRPFCPDWGGICTFPASVFSTPPPLCDSRGTRGG